MRRVSHANPWGKRARQKSQLRERSSVGTGLGDRNPLDGGGSGKGVQTDVFTSGTRCIPSGPFPRSTEHFLYLGFARL